MDIVMNKPYVKKARIMNLGAIKSTEINFQFDDAGNPKPTLLVGPNGSGKTVFLASIVNSLTETINYLYSDHQHKFMSSEYIGYNADYAWQQVEFTTGHSFLSLALHSPKTSESPLQFNDEVMKEAYDEIGEGATSRNYWDFVTDSSIQSDFFDNCMLYLPVNRFEDPAWLIKNWESQKSQYVQVRDGGNIKDPRHNIIEYSSLQKNKQWVRSVLEAV